MTEKQIVTRIRQIMYDRKLSGTDSNAGELNRLKTELKALRGKQGVTEGNNSSPFNQEQNLRSKSDKELADLIQFWNRALEKNPEHKIAREQLGLIKMIRAERIGKQGMTEVALAELSKDTLKSYSKERGATIHADQRDSSSARDIAADKKKQGDLMASDDWDDEANWLDKRAEKGAKGVAQATIKIAKKGVAENYDDFEDEEESDLHSGDYVRDKDDPSGEIFIMRGDPYDRRVQITDRNGSGWTISPSRLIAVDDSDPAIARYFGSQDVEEGSSSEIYKMPPTKDSIQREINKKWRDEARAASKQGNPWTPTDLPNYVAQLKNAYNKEQDVAEGMKALAKAGREGDSEKELDAIRDQYDKYNESWSQKYKNSINCSHPKGFSQKAHCAGKKKHNEDINMEMVCEDCGMCQTHGRLDEIKKGQKDSNGNTKCWPGKHAQGTKKGKNGGQVRNCVPNESVAEDLENNATAQKIFFARSNVAPKGWSYDHVGFITQDGKQIQMSGHKGNDVYVTNAVTDDPEFPKQNIKIVSLSKPVSVPTTNSVGAENCGTFVANVLKSNGIKGFDTEKLYAVMKTPLEQGVAEDPLNEEWSYASDKKYTNLGTYKRYNVYVGKKKFNNLYFIAVAENPRTLDAKYKAKGETSDQAVDKLKLEIDKEIDTAVKVSGAAAIDFNVNFVKEVLESSTSTFYAKIISGPRLVLAGPEMMEYPEIMHDEGFKSSSIRTIKVGEDATKLPAVPLSASAAQASGVIANGRYVLGSETIDKDGNRVFDLIFDSVVENPRDHVRLKEPAITIGTNRSRGVAEETALDNVRGQSDVLSRMQRRSQQRDDDMRDEEMSKKRNRQKYDDASTQNDIDTLAYRLDRLKRQDDDWEHTFDMLRDRTNRYQRSGQQGVDPNIKYQPTVKEDKSRKTDKKGRTQQQWIQLVTKKYPDANIMQAKMIDGTCYATLSDGKKLYWYPATQSTADRKEETMQNQEKARDAFANMFGGSMQQLGNLGIKKNRDVSEANRKQDRRWEDEADQEMSTDKNSPYYVLWTGQSHEWYGNGDPKSGHGRYKPKGEAGGIVAINIKDRDTAEKIADSLNAQAEDGTFFEKAIYNTWNKDYYLVDYMGAEARSMKKIDEYEQRMLDYDLKSGRVKDYANQGMMEDDAATQAFKNSGGKVTVGKYHGPRKSEKTNYGSRHIGGPGDPMKASRTGTAANTQADTVVGMARRIREGLDVAIHDLSDMSDREAYDETQVNSDIKDGDVLKVQNGVGFLYKAWPVLVSGSAEGFAELASGSTWEDFEDGKYMPSVQKALEVADQGVEEGSMGGINRCAPSSDVSYEKVLDEVKQQWKRNKNTTLESKITTAVDYIMSEEAHYKQIGIKVKGSKQVPNCVPISEHEVTLEGDVFIGIYEDSLLEADYHGHKVQLNKPMQGDVKKFKVYVTDPSTGNIKKVNFGDPNMRIRKSNPGARKSFRARHHCENPGPRTSARYWSCRQW